MSTDDHELKIGTVTKGLKLLKDENKSAMYKVIEDTPEYQSNLLFTQDNWIGGHGQYDFIEPDMYFEGQSIDTTQPNKLILGPLIYEVKESDDSDLDSAPVCFCWFPATSEWLCATSGKIYRYDVGSNGKWTAATTTVASVTNLAVHDAVMYALRGTSNAYYYSTDGDTWTLSTLTYKYGSQIFTAPNSAGTAMVLWKFKAPNELRDTTDGRNTGDSGVEWCNPPNYIGDTSSNVTQIFLSGDKIMVGREDNLYYFDSDGGLHPYMADLAHSRSTNNYKYITEWQNMKYCSIVTDIGEISPYDSFKLMEPLHKVGDINKVGTCVGLASERKWLYAAIDEGTNTHIYKGREIYEDGKLKWQWCPWVFLSTNACTTIKVCQHSATDRRLWFGYGNNTGYVILSDNPLADSSAKFAASGWIRMSYTVGTNKYWDKLWQSIVTETEACTANLTVTPKYRKDTDTGTGTALTAAITTNGTVKTNLTAELSCKRIQFELHLATNSSSTTPEVSFFEVRGVEKPETVRVHEAVYSLGDKPSERAKTIRTFLRGGRTSTSLIRFADLRYGETTGGTAVAGTDFVYCVMMPGSPTEVEMIHIRGKDPELGIQVRLQEVSFT